MNSQRRSYSPLFPYSANYTSRYTLVHTYRHTHTHAHSYTHAHIPNYTCAVYITNKKTLQSTGLVKNNINYKKYSLKLHWTVEKMYENMAHFGHKDLRDLIYGIIMPLYLGTMLYNRVF